MQNKKFTVWMVVGIVTLVVSWFVFRSGVRTEVASALDGFAQCLTEKGFTMYGAYWCPHCQNEKEAFGDSFKYVNYVECTENPSACTSAGVKGFPTWITADGRIFEGEMGIEGLAEASRCSLGSH